MESKKNMLLLTAVIICSVSFAFVSCASDEDECLNPNRNDMVASSQVYTAKLCLDICKEDYDGTHSSGMKRSTTNEWEDGDKLYLIFTSDTKTVSGTATYSSSDDWVLKYNGLLTRDKKTNVKVFYFTNVIDENSESLYIDATCGIYKDEAGLYLYPSESSEIKLTATLRPITGRLLIKGDLSSNYNIDGITYYSRFNLDSGNLSVTSEPLFDLNTQTYLYGYFDNPSNRNIKVKNGNFLYSANCPENFLQIGKSGYISLPTHEVHNGWSEKAVGGWYEGSVDSEEVEEWVDLDLPSGLKWSVDEFYASDDNEELDRDWYSDGESYPWGATWFSSSGKKDNYSSKTTDISGTVYDPVWFYYNKNARCPKQTEFQELVDNLIWRNRYYKNKNGENVYSGVRGYCKANLTYIDLYASGRTVWDFTNWTAEYEEQECGFYWTSTPYTKLSSTQKAYFYRFSEDNPIPELWYGSKANGMLIKPVIVNVNYN